MNIPTIWPLSGGRLETTVSSAPHEHANAVVKAPDAALPAPDLGEWLSSRVNSYQHVRDVVFLEALPRSAIGKVLKRDLRAAYVEGAR